MIDEETAEDDDGDGVAEPEIVTAPPSRAVRYRSIAALAREHGERAVEVLVAGMESGDARVRVAAAKEILDRGFGKAVAMSVDLSNRLDAFDDTELEAALPILDAVAARRGRIRLQRTARGRAGGRADTARRTDGPGGTADRGPGTQGSAGDPG